jgi:8-oxo-dGTP pyrophosphatase MutT (NUDIX family)
MRPSKRNLLRATEWSGTQGWRRGEGAIVLENPSLRVRVLHVGWVDEHGKPLYDQPLLLEPVGTITLPVDEQGRVGLIEAQRPMARDQAAYRLSYASQQTGCPDIDPAAFGCVVWEAPRGYPKWAPANRLEKPGETAVRETAEETGSQVVSCEYLCDCVTNSTFFPQAVPCFLVRLDLSRPGTPDELEGVGTFRFFTLARRATSSCS